MEAFSFSVTPAMELILVINMLEELNFDSPRRARIDVGEGGFEITVYDNRFDDGIPTEIFKSVSFDAASLTGFHCQVPLSRMIEFDEIRRCLDHVDYHGSVRIFSGNGTMLSVASLSPYDAGLESANFINIALTPKLPTVSAFVLEHLPLWFTDFMTKFGSGTCPYFAQVWQKDEDLWMTSNEYSNSETAPREFARRLAEREIWFLFTGCTHMRKQLDPVNSRVYMATDPSDYLMLRNSLEGFGEFIIIQSLNESLLNFQPLSLETFAPRT